MLELYYYLNEILHEGYHLNWNLIRIIIFTKGEGKLFLIEILFSINSTDNNRRHNMKLQKSDFPHKAINISFL